MDLDLDNSDVASLESQHSSQRDFDLDMNGVIETSNRLDERTDSESQNEFHLSPGSYTTSTSRTTSASRDSPATEVKKIDRSESIPEPTPHRPSDPGHQYFVWMGELVFTVLLLSCAFVVQEDVEDVMGLNAGLIFGSIGTLITCGTISVWYYAFPHDRRHINIMLVNKSFVDILLALSFLFHPIWTSYGLDKVNDERSCKYLSMLREYAIINSNMWIFCIALDLLWLVYIILTQVVAILSALGVSLDEAIFGVAKGHFCWIKQHNVLATYLLNHIPIFLTTVFSIIVIYRAYTRLYHGIPSTLATRRRLLLEGCSSTCAFMLYSLLLWTLYFSLGKDANEREHVKLVYDFFLAYRGSVVFFLWMLYNKVNPFSRVSEESSVLFPDEEVRVQANVALQKELVFFTTRAIEQCVREADRRYSRSNQSRVESLRSSFTLRAPQSLHATASKSTSKCKITEFDPKKYWRIRRHYGIQTEDYVASFNATTSAIMISEGSSGAFMFFSGNRNYVVKSLTLSESEFLQSIVSNYLGYLMTHPQSFLVRFLGSYAMKLYGKRVYFVVMENVLDIPPSINLRHRYDIKGSWVQRNATKPRIGCEVMCRYCHTCYRVGQRSTCPDQAGPHVPDVVLKDMDLATKLQLGKVGGQEVLQQLTRDSIFLSEHGIMDYSLLIGVIEMRFSVTQPPPTTITSSSVSLDLENTVARKEQSQVALRWAETVVGPGGYYLGIIDILQTWTWQKQLERMFKIWILRKDPDGISVMEPTDYRKRFEQKLDEIIDAKSDFHDSEDK